MNFSCDIGFIIYLKPILSKHYARQYHIFDTIVLIVDMIKKISVMSNSPRFVVEWTSDF